MEQLGTMESTDSVWQMCNLHLLCTKAILPVTTHYKYGIACGTVEEPCCNVSSVFGQYGIRGGCWQYLVPVPALIPFCAASIK